MATVVDGRAIAREVLAEVAAQVALLPQAPRLSIVTCTPDFATQRYLTLKQRKAAEVGIRSRVIELLPEISTHALVSTVRTIAGSSDGVVVQLPLPAHIDREAVLAAVPVSKDPDGFAYENEPGACLPPVVGAIVEIAARHNVSFTGKRVAVVGAGRLVGAPAAHYLREHGAQVDIIEKGDRDRRQTLRAADVIISGVGVPNLITAADVTDGVVVFDAGTAEANGKLAGDVAPDVAARAALITPVPGGIGPLTVAVLLRNLVGLAQARSDV